MNHNGEWPIKIHPLAVKDLDRLKRDNPSVFSALLNGLKLLAQEPDPYKPQNKRLNVCKSYPHARECMRVKIVGQSWRAVLRIIEVNNGYAYVVGADDELNPSADNAYLQLVFADIRSDATYNLYLADRATALARG